MKKVFARLSEDLRHPKAYAVLGTSQESHFCSKSIPYYIFIMILSNQAILASVCRTVFLVAAVCPDG